MLFALHVPAFFTPTSSRKHCFIVKPVKDTKPEKRRGKNKLRWKIDYFLIFASRIEFTFSRRAKNFNVRTKIYTRSTFHHWKRVFHPFSCASLARVL